MRMTRRFRPVPIAVLATPFPRSAMMVGMETNRFIVGDWMGTQYNIAGTRYDWRLSLWSSGAYQRAVSSHESGRLENGQWTLDEEGRVLLLQPSDNGSTSRWIFEDVTGYEFARTLLVLRSHVLGSRILPILLYRVHPLPGPPIPLDAHGFSSFSEA
jgi:hypothetical protein